MIKSAKALKIENWMPFVLITAVFLILIWRCHFGFDWSDESYYAALSYRFYLGDPLFLSSWEIPQISSLITLPFIGIYRVFTQNMNGILLYLRILFTCFQFAVSLFIYVKIKTKTGKAGAVLASLFFMLAPFSIRTFSYNTLPLLFLPVAVFCLMSVGERRPGAVKYFISGAFTALAVMAYPALIIAVFCFLVYILYGVIFKKNITYKALAAYISGGIFIIGLFLAFLIVNSSFSNAIHNFKYMFSDPEHQTAFSVFSYFEILIFEKWQWFVAFAVLTAASAGYACLRKRAGKIASGVGFVFCMILIVLMFIIFLTILLGKPEYNLYAVHYICMLIAAAAPALCFILGKRPGISGLLYAIGVCFSFSVSLSSNNGSRGFSFPFILCAAATVMYVFESISPAEYSPRVVRTAGYVSAVLGTGLISLLFYFNITMVYRDQPLNELNTKMVSGPAAGIYTTAGNQVKYEEIIHVISKYRPKEGRVLYFNLLPFGYLCGGNLPATPRIWRTKTDYFGFEEYFRNNPENLPHLIFIVSGDYGLSNRIVELPEYWKNYIAEKGFYKVETKTGDLYLAPKL